MSDGRGLDNYISRRKLLIGLGGIPVLTGAGYAGARELGREGRINGRFVNGEDYRNGGLVGSTSILTVIDNETEPARHVNPDYQEYVPPEPPLTVSLSLHRRLQEEFDHVSYALSQNCPDANCSTPRVSREDFNSAGIGTDVRLLYHSGDEATIIP